MTNIAKSTRKMLDCMRLEDGLRSRITEMVEKMRARYRGLEISCDLTNVTVRRKDK